MLENQPTESCLTSDKHAVLATIYKLFHSNASVRMPDGQEASLAWKEVWSRFKVHDRHTDYKVFEDIYYSTNVVKAESSNNSVPNKSGRLITEGDKILVVPYGSAFGSGYKISVSHIRAYNNPWLSVATWKDKDIKSFFVESVTKTYALGTIDPGVRARVYIGGLANLLPNNSWHGHQIPLAGDEIAGWFLCENVDEKEQIVTLDYENYILSNVSILSFLPFAEYTQMHFKEIQVQNSANSNLYSNENHLSIRKCLLLDDDKDFLKSLSQYLNDKYDIEVLSCKNDHEAIFHINKTGAEIDIAIIDVNLGTKRDIKKDYDGILIARYLRNLFPNCPIVLTTGEEIDPTNPKITQEPILTVQDVVYKPFDTDSLLKTLSAIGKSARKLPDLCSHESKNHDSVNNTENVGIQESLIDLKDSLSAEATVLFRLCPITDEVVILAVAGPEKKYNSNKRRLAWSPIRDAALSAYISETQVGSVFSVAS